MHLGGIFLLHSLLFIFERTVVDILNVIDIWLFSATFRVVQRTTMTMPVESLPLNLIMSTRYFAIFQK